MNINIIELIQYITWLATERDEVLSPIRLVKFIYLVDLYNARENNGVTVTGWPWKFVHYGPFCMESLQAIQKAVNQGFIDAIPYESQFDDEEHFLYRYKADREPAIGSRLPFYITGPLREAIKKWAGDTYGLLEHVYFETEPMIRVNPGDLLDFTNAQEAKGIEQIPMSKLSKQKLAEGKRLIAKMSRLLKERTKIDTGQPIYDETYFDALDYLDGERLDFPIKGKAKIEDSVSELD